MEPLLCNDCNTPAELKVSKAGKGYYNCPNCPSSNAAYKSKFLTFIEGAEEYKKKRTSPRQNCNPCDKIKDVVKEKVVKRKAEKPLECPEEKRLKILADQMEEQVKKTETQIRLTDQLLERIEKLLENSSRRSPSEEETEDVTE